MLVITGTLFSFKNYKIKLKLNEMSLVNRNFKAFKHLQRFLYPTRSIGDVGKSNDVNIFDVFNTKKLQKERAAKR